MKVRDMTTDQLVASVFNKIDTEELGYEYDELLRRLNRFDGLEDKLIAAVDEWVAGDYVTNGSNTSAKNAITATFAAVRESNDE